MQVIDIDSELLWRNAQAAKHSSEEGSRHVGYEIDGTVEQILSTLAPQGPMASPCASR